MKISVKAIDFKADSKLIDFIEERSKKLQHFFDKIIEVDVHLHLENTSEKENKIVEFTVRVPGDDIFVKKVAKAFEQAVDLAVDTISRQLKKRKEKSKSY